MNSLSLENFSYKPAVLTQPEVRAAPRPAVRSFVMAPYKLGWAYLKSGLSVSSRPLNSRIWTVIKGLSLLVPLINYLFFVVIVNKLKKQLESAAFHENMESESNENQISLTNSISQVLPHPTVKKYKLMNYTLSSPQAHVSDLRRIQITQLTSLIFKKKVDILILQCKDEDELKIVKEKLDSKYFASLSASSRDAPIQINFFRKEIFDENSCDEVTERSSNNLLVSRVMDRKDHSFLTVYNVYFKKTQSEDYSDFNHSLKRSSFLGGGNFQKDVPEQDPENLSSSGLHFDRGTGISNSLTCSRDEHLFASQEMEFEKPHVDFGLSKTVSTHYPVISKVIIR